jgi:hypothetical protein
MRSICNYRFGVAVLALLPFVALQGMAQNAPATPTIASRTANVGGVKLHYLTAGSGPPLILLHGYTQTSLM